MKKTCLPLLFIPILLASCTNDSPDDLTVTVPVGTADYTTYIKPIMENNCVSCHAATPNSGAPMSLVTYEQVKQAVQQRGLIDRINRQFGDPLLMPLGGPRLPQPTINLVQEWADQGFTQ